MTGSEKNIDQLIQDDRFIRWVISPDEQSDRYWQAWQQENFLRKDMVAEARRIVLSIYSNEESKTSIADPAVIAVTWQEISQRLESAETPGRRRIFSLNKLYKYAAAILIIVAITTLWVWYRSPATEIVSTKDRSAVKAFVQADIEFKNNNEKEEVVNLADGSRIILSKNASIRFNRLFNKRKREVFLQGEAFFEIARDTSRPFYVYSGNVVTKVLGTSFRILSDSSSGKVTVAVRTGKVTVFRQDQKEEKAVYILTPHEQVVFENVTASPSKQSITDTTLLADKLPAARHFDFEEAQMTAILEALSKFYSVEIVNSHPGNQQCLVTVSLSDGSLYNKLDILQKVTGATWYIKDQKIYVNSKECK